MRFVLQYCNIKIDELNITVVLLVDGRANPLTRRFPDAKKVKEAKELLREAPEARADQPKYSAFSATEWAAMRDNIKDAQKALTHYDPTSYAMVQD